MLAKKTIHSFSHALGFAGMVLFNPAAMAESNIDRQTETAMPRQKNMYGLE